MSESGSLYPFWNVQSRRFLTAFLLVAGCRLEPEGTAALPDADVDDTPPSAEHEPKDASLAQTMLPPAMGTGDPVRDAGARPKPVDAGRSPDTDASVHDAAASDAGSGEQPSPVDSGMSVPHDPAACTIQGYFALETEIDVEWSGSSVGNLALTAPGSGKIVMRSLTQLDETTRQATLSPCQLSMPDFQTAPNSVIGKEVYGMDVPDEAWDGPAMPHWQTPWGLSCSAPGCTIFSGMLESVVGARVTSMPFSWPEADGPREGFEVTDDDSDGLPGLTYVTRGPDFPTKREQPYSYPPLVTSLLYRARSVMLATGMRAQMQGTLQSCDHYSGTLSFGGVYARTLGCMKQYGTRPEEPCDEEDLQFLDENLPVWRVLSGRFRATRIATPSCATVRAQIIEP
jgi:hypothetical protein